MGGLFIRANLLIIMDVDGLTYISFVTCELQGGWDKIKEESDINLEIFRAKEENAKISVRIFDKDNSESYYLKKDSIISIKDNIVQFSKKDFSKTSTQV